jgi:hypothetical protein
MEDLPSHPFIAEMWCDLFQQNQMTQLQKLMVTVNTGIPKIKKKKNSSTKT